MKRITLSVAFKDKRGRITDLVENENINAVTMLTFTQGAVRANHYHKETYQWNYVIKGRIRIAAQIPGEHVRSTVMKEGDFTLTAPYEAHALEGLEDSVLLVLTKGPRGGQQYESDTYRLDTPLIALTKGAPVKKKGRA